MNFTMHAHGRTLFSEEQALIIMAQWMEYLGDEFHLDRYEEPGDVKYSMSNEFDPSSLKRMIPKWKLYGGFLIPLLLKNGCCVSASVSMESSSFALDFTNKVFTSFYDNHGVTGLMDCLEWIANKANADYGHIDSISIQKYVGYHFYTESSQGSIHRIAPRNALDQIEWINYFSNEIIDEYGRSLLMRANWQLTRATSNGMIFVAYDYPPEYELNTNDSDQMDRILAEIEYYRRWEEQASRVDSAKRDSIEVREGVDLVRLKKKWGDAIQARRQRDRKKRLLLKKIRVNVGVLAALAINEHFYKNTAANLASIGAEACREAIGITLDYTPESLMYIEKVIDSCRAKNKKICTYNIAFICLGCYVGEVMIRATKASWVDPSTTQMASMTNSPYVIQYSQEKCCDPISKVFKRFKAGPTESIEYFFQVFTKSTKLREQQK